MAKKPVRVTAEEVAQADLHVSALVIGRLKTVGAGRLVARYKREDDLRRQHARKLYREFQRDGGKAGDWQSFAVWLLEHADEIFAFVAKLIALLSV